MNFMKVYHFSVIESKTLVLYLNLYYLLITLPKKKLPRQHSFSWDPDDDDDSLFTCEEPGIDSK